MLLALSKRRRTHNLRLLQADLYRLERVHLLPEAKNLIDCFTRRLDFKVAKLPAVVCVCALMSA